jgi:hypothetical protein
MISERQVAGQSQAKPIAPHDFAIAAKRYQLYRELESEQLAIMARQNLLTEWSAETRATVLAAREFVRDTREARTCLREAVRDFVGGFRNSQEPLKGVLHQTRAMVQTLERAGAIHDDNGWFEAEILEWAIEEYGRIS